MLVLSLTIDKVLAKNNVLLDTDALCNPHCPKRSSSPEQDPLLSGGRHYRPSHIGLHQQSKGKQAPTYRAWLIAVFNLQLLPKGPIAGLLVKTLDVSHNP